jgi:hypothetical protein
MKERSLHVLEVNPVRITMQQLYVHEVMRRELQRYWSDSLTAEGHFLAMKRPV